MTSEQAEASIRDVMETVGPLRAYEALRHGLQTEPATQFHARAVQERRFSQRAETPMCATCRYSEPFNQTFVLCRRYPPVRETPPIFPVVPRGAWCGEHRGKDGSSREE